jgi:uncharacterized coiled-coil DUF342 family protein
VGRGRVCERVGSAGGAQAQAKTTATSLHELREQFNRKQLQNERPAEVQEVQTSVNQMSTAADQLTERVYKHTCIMFTQL